MTSAPADTSILVEILRANQDRNPKLIRLKLKLMAGSAFAFFRGACEFFARDWQELVPRGAGPSLLVCGDLHLENFGAYRDDEGEFLFDINDFDESCLGPAPVDPVRCAASILLAAELWDLSPLHANRLVIAYLDEYRQALTLPVKSRAIDSAAPRLSRGPIWEILGKTAIATQSQLLDHHTERLKNGTRRIIRDKRKHPELVEAEARTVLGAVKAYALASHQAEALNPLDVTGRVAGIGSLGVKRYLVLVAGGGSAETNRLLDVKEARPSVWLPFAGIAPALPGASDAAGVVHAQCTLQARPTAGLDVLPIDGEDFRVREMIPEENRSSLDRFQHKPAKLYQAIVEAGRLTGLAHLRAAQAVEGHDETAALTDWAHDPALDSLLAAASRCAEQTRLAFKQFRAERKVPEALPAPLKDLVIP